MATALEKAVLMAVLLTDMLLIGRWASYRFEWLAWTAALRRHKASEATLSQSAPPEPPIAPFAREWSLVHPFLVLQMVLMLTGVLAGAVAALLGATGGAGLGTLDAPTANALLAGLFLQDALFVGFVALFLRRYGTSLSEIGLRRLSARQVGMAVGLGVCLLLVSGIAEQGWLFTLRTCLSPHTMRSLEDVAKAVSAEGIYARFPYASQRMALIVGGVVAAPIAEEVFFRGFVYNTLERRVRNPAAILLSAACFALMHVSPLSMPIIFVMGIVLAVAYQRTRSLTFTILVHAINNGFSFAILMAQHRH